MRLLLVEDNPRLAALTRKQLQEAGFAVDAVGELGDAEAALATTRFDAVILDLGLPDGDGGALLKQLRARRDATPVLVLTARDALGERVQHLDWGADDYLVKPFAIEELVARIRALLRRPGQALAARLSFGDVALDVAARAVAVGERQVALSRRELALLELFLRHPQRVVAKSDIERALYGFDDEVGANTLEVLVHRLRKRLADGGSRVTIEAMRGIGYLLAHRKA
jgi:DNA-binding response OmpR family regulator